MDDQGSHAANMRQTIANAERLIAEVEEALAQADRLFAQRNIDRDLLVKSLKHQPGGEKLLLDIKKGVDDMAEMMAKKSEQIMRDRQAQRDARVLQEQIRQGKQDDGAAPADTAAGRPARRQHTMI
jgi:uncharacterized protein YajQ (UPF0234 family)